MYKQQPLTLFDISQQNSIDNPIPMQYLGSKARIASWILDRIQAQYSNLDSFVDIFAGTGSVSLEAKNRGYKIIANDLQPYSSVVLKSLFIASRYDLTNIANNIIHLKSDNYLLSGLRSITSELLEKERLQFENSGKPGWDWNQYRLFCEKTKLIEGSKDDVREIRAENGWNLFTRYYTNTYFGVEQCLHLDAIRQYVDALDSEDIKTHILAATITAMTFAVSSTTHLAQFLKPTSSKRSQHLIKRRQVNIIDNVSQRLNSLDNFSLPSAQAIVHQLDFREALNLVNLNENSVVYVDPPYFKEHYSRYYHVLDTFTLYDYPELTYNHRIGSTTIGRYREDRAISDFGLKSSVENAFSDLFNLVYESGAKLVVSYANTSLVSKEQLLELATKAKLTCKVEEVKLMHSGQGQPRNKTVTEYLFLMEPVRN